MDPFAQLPNEVMSEVFKHLPSSLPAKFKLAAVNRKFRANILRMLLNEPMYLDMNFKRQTINGVKIPRSKWPDALAILNQRTNINKLHIAGQWKRSALDRILNSLLKMDSMRRLLFFNGGASCSSPVLGKFLEKSVYLAMLNLKAPVSRVPSPNTCAINLRSAFSNKPLLQFLRLILQDYPVEELIAAFKSLQPNTLQICALDVRQRLDLVQLIRRVPAGVWGSLNSLYFTIRTSEDTQLELLDLVARLPQLSYCSIIYDFSGIEDMIVPFGQFAAIVASLFNGQPFVHQVSIQYDPCCEVTPGCVVINFVRTLQRHHPQVQFNFGQHEQWRLKFTLGKLNFSSRCPVVRYCGAQECVECHSFYPCVIVALFNQAVESPVSAQLHGHQLDRCKVGRVVEDMNHRIRVLRRNFTALTAVANEAQDSATITFEPDEGEQFYITVDCGHCFDSCVGCVVV